MASQTVLSTSPDDGAGSGLVSCSEHINNRQQTTFSTTMENNQTNFLHAPNPKLGDASSDDFLKSLLVSEDHQDFSVEPSRILMPDILTESDDDWKNIQQGSINWIHSDRLLPCKMVNAAGEITLEDFERRTGICKEDGSLSFVPTVLLSNSDAAGLDAEHSASTAGILTSDIQLDWMKFVNSQTEQLIQQPVVKNEFLSPGFYGGRASNFGDSTSYSPNNFSRPNLAGSTSISEFLSSGEKPPATDSVIEKIMERRQRRMIKNRESAARSRARKQAHTFKLEAEVTYLKEENARLRQEQASRMRLLGNSETKIQGLRRTRSW